MIIHRLKPFLKERAKHLKKMVPLSGTFFIYIFGWALVYPIFNIRVNEVTGSFFLSGIIFSMLGIAGVLLDSPIGRLCDRFDPKKLLQTSLLCYTLIFLLYTFADSFALLFFTRMIHSLAYVFLWVSGWTMIRKLTKGRYAQEEISAWSTVQNIAYIIAPLIGGFLITFYSWPIVFYLASITSFISFLYATYSLREVKVNHHEPMLKFREQFRLFFKKKDSSVRLVLLTLILYILITSFGSFMPLQLNDKGLNIEQIAIIMSLATTTPYILFPIIIGVLSDKYGRKIPTLFGLIFMALGFYLFSITSSFTQFLFYTFIAYSGMAFVLMCVNAELNDLLNKKDVGCYTGFFEMIKDSGIMIGALITGFIAAIGGISFAFMILSLISLASIVILKGFKDF